MAEEPNPIPAGDAGQGLLEHDVRSRCSRLIACDIAQAIPARRGRGLGLLRNLRVNNNSSPVAGN